MRGIALQLSQFGLELSFSNLMSQRFIRRAIIVGFLCAMLYLLHPWILRGMAGWLIADRSDGVAEAVAIISGDQRFEWAARCFRENPSIAILLFEGPPDRLVNLKIRKSMSDLDRQTLQDRNVAAENIQVLSFSQRDEWEWARHLDDWLEKNSERTIVVGCDRFQSGFTSFLLDQTVGEDRRGRVIVQPLADRRYDESNWWKSRTGVKAFWYAGFNLVYAIWVGEDTPPSATWDADAYEEALGS